MFPLRDFPVHVSLRDFPVHVSCFPYDFPDFPVQVFLACFLT